jgi:virginiamycin B lyase
MKTFALSSTLALLVLGAGCGGSGGSTVPAKSPAQTPATTMVAFRIVLPTTASNARRRLPRYVSASTQSAAITAAPGGGSAGAPVIVNCTTVCTGQIVAAVGSDTFTVSLYDAQNAVGNLLSTGTLTQTIVQNQANSVNVTLDGVVASLTVALNPAAVTEGTAATVAVTVNALDADGNTIVGPGIYANASGSPLTVALVDSDGSGATHLSLSSLTAPTTGITLSFNGTTIPNPTITASASGATSGHALLTLSGGTGTITPFTTGITGDPTYITAGPDGALWFTERGHDRIGRITVGGTVTEYSTGLSAGAEPYRITAGSDGALWFTEIALNQVGRISTSGTITEYSSGITELPGSGTLGIAAGSDGALWFTEGFGNKLGRITTAGAINEYALGSRVNEHEGYIAAGPDNNLWFFFDDGPIGRMTTSGSLSVFGGLPFNDDPANITAGPDGNLWATDWNGTRITQITTSGVVTSFSAGITSGSRPWDIATGSDGNLWFTEFAGSHIGRITPSGTVTEFPYNGSTTYGIAAGPDGGLWFTDGISTVNRIQP